MNRHGAAARVALLALVPVLLTSLPATAAPTAAPAAAQLAAHPAAQVDLEQEPLEIAVSELSPRAPTAADQVVRVAGTVTNRGEEPVDDVELRLHVDRVLTSRSQLARADEDRRIGRARGPVLPLEDTTLRPGESAPFELTMTVGDLRLGPIGSYPVAVQARGRPEDARRSSALGRATTFLPWFPDGPPQRTRIAWLWPLVDSPRTTPSGVLLDDDLARSLSTDAERSGRLGRLLASTRAAPQVPVTFAVDPDLLTTVSTMTEPYLVRRSSGEPAERPAAPTAVAWLEALRTALANAPPDGAARAPRGLLSLPYGDPDVVALARSSTGLGEDVELLRRRGELDTTEITGREPDPSVAWPPAGGLTPAALDLALAGDTRAVVLDEVALEPLSFDSNLTPSAPVQLASASAGALTGLVVEQGLSRLLQAGPQDAGWQGVRLAEQRFLAETAMIVAESPAVARTLVVAPDRRGDVVPALATSALQSSVRLPWLCAVELMAVANGTAVCPEPVEGEQPAELTDRGALAPPDPDAPLLSQAYLAELAQIRALSEQLTDQVLLPGPEAVETKRRLLRARGRSESSAWRERPRTGRLLTELLAEDVEALRDQITLRTSGRVALSGSTGTVTVSIFNALEQPVTVGVDLNDPVEARLTSTSTEVTEVPATNSLQVPIEVTTRTSGQFVVRATLLDRSGTPFGEPVELIVRSTGYSRAALAVTGLGGAVLLVAAGVRITRRALRRAPT